MKKNINDYKRTKTAIEVNSIEEFDRIKKLLGHTKQNGEICFNKNKNYISCFSDDYANKEWWINKGFTLYKTSDFLEEEIKFEVDKWYYVELGIHKHYLKFKKIDKDRAFIDKGGYIESLKKWSYGISIDIENVTFYRLLTDLSEIQEFLPDNHPDKIKLSVSFRFNINDKVKLKSGGCYISSPESWVKESHESEFPSERYGTFDKIADRKHCQNLNWYKPFNGGNWITEEGLELTKTEIIPENVECIKQDKFIPEEDLHLYDDSGLLIKKEEAMFKKNDYIVVLYNDNSLNSWTNQCFKQLEDLYYLKVVKNLNGNTDGWSVINFKNQSKWRYASSAEILEYERIGKPFDVTTLIKKEKSLVKQVQEGLKLKGRWLKCIKQCDWNTINVGEYIQILENNSLVPYVEWKDNEEGHCIDLGRIDKKEFELMPEEFSLNEKTEYKVGDWVFGKSLGTSNYNKCKHPVKIIEIKEDRFKYDLLSNPKTDYPRNKSCFYYLSTIVRKATEQDIAMHLGSIIHNQYPLTPIESFQLSIYDLKDIYIAPIIKKETKIQTITIESTTDLNLNLKTIKSKQIQTIKI